MLYARAEKAFDIKRHCAVGSTGGSPGMTFRERRVIMNCITMTNRMGEIERELENWVKGWEFPFADFEFNSRGYAVPIDFSEDEEGYTVRADLPGVAKEDIDISLTDRVLAIKGEKKAEKEEGDKRRYHRRETWAGGFERKLVLPASADAASVKAELKDGVLTLTMRKSEEAKPRSIVVNG
jgi:HSP20 family protein